MNYNQLPHIMWEKMLPDYFHIPTSTVMIDKMKDISGVYSKGRGQKANQEWQEDSAKKQNTASSFLIDASNRFVGDIYKQMEELSKKK